MKKSNSERNVALYKWFVLFAEPLFWGPILTQTMMVLGKMKLPEIFFMEACVVVITVILNIPTGAFADIIGRKKTLIIGQAFLLASFVGFAFMSAPWHVWLSNILWAIGFSFQTGSDHALIYHSLKGSGQKDFFTEIEGKAVGYRLGLMAVCALLVGHLAVINLRLPLLLCIPFITIPFIISFFFIEERETRKFDMKEQVKTMLGGISLIYRKSELWWIIGFVSLLGVAGKIWFFTYNSYFMGVGVEVKHYGLIFCLLNLVAWYFSHNASRIERKFSERLCIIGMILCTGVPILLMGIFPFWFMALLVLAQNVTRGFMRPFTSNYVNRHIDSEEVRATVLSAKSTCVGIFEFLSLFVFGIVNASVGLFTSMAFLGITVLLLGLLSYYQYRLLFRQKPTMIKVIEINEETQ